MGKIMMANLVRKLADSGNPQSANHWLTYMAQLGQPLDSDTHEWVRQAHPMEILPSILSGESVECKAPRTRPATVGGEQRRESGSLPPLQQHANDFKPIQDAGSLQFAALCSPRRVPARVRTKIKSQMSPRRGNASSGFTDNMTIRATAESWLSHASPGDFRKETNL